MTVFYPYTLLCLSRVLHMKRRLSLDIQGGEEEEEEEDAFRLDDIQGGEEEDEDEKNAAMLVEMQEAIRRRTAAAAAITSLGPTPENVIRRWCSPRGALRRA